MPELATVAAFGFPDFHPPVILDLYRRLGCTSSQFYRNTANPPAEADAMAICRDAGVPITSLHGVFGSDIDPSSPDEPLRRRSVDRYIGEGELALRLGASSVVVHPSPLTPGSKHMSDGDRSTRRSRLSRSMEELADMGERIGVGHDVADMARMIRAIDHPRLRMCLDMGHAFITDDLPARLTDCRDVITYLHVHDNDGTIDSHQMPGDGTTDWAKVAAALDSYDANVPAMLEVFYLRDKLAEMADAGLGAKLRQWLAITSPRA
jgi:sugar phosphate isomerase/epimerase